MKIPFILKPESSRHVLIADSSTPPRWVATVNTEDDKDRAEATRKFLEEREAAKAA